MSVESGERAGSADADSARGAADAQSDAVLAAGVRLLTALRRLGISLATLLVAEARVFKASIGLVFIASIALVAFAVSLWFCVIALIGWGLTLATGSIGIALAILVVLHLILVVALWFMIKRAIHHASFPRVRGEFAASGRSLRRDMARFRQASTPPPDDEAAP
ncbi:MAG TPA: hypothetical protein VFP92_07650 [Rhodanobacteraceae bacterium]|nr:hypothetical protein [Rhodanobacteraceae bacterium]